jgi:SOS-response transcriptional repressor LexA
MNYGKTIEILRKYLNTTNAGLEKILGLSNGYISNIEKNGTDNPGKLLVALKEKGISTDWFLTGKGDMFRGQEPEKPVKEEKHPIDSHIEALINENMKAKVEGIVSRLEAVESSLKELRVPKAAPEPEAEYPAEAGAGESYVQDHEPDYGRVLCFEDIAAGPPIWQFTDSGRAVDVPLRLIKTKLGDYYALRVRGNSMIDAFIPDGSMVLIRKSDAPEHGKIQVVRVDDRITLKRMREEEDHSWTLCYEDGTGRTIPLGEENLVQGDFVAVLPPFTQPYVVEE